MIDSLGKPDFFSRVDKADQKPSKSKEADASELLSTSNSKSSASEPKAKESTSKTAEPKSFDHALRKVQANNSRGEVTDGAEKLEDDNYQNKVARRATDPKSKKEMEDKAAKSSEFVMPEMFPSKFSVPKHALETEISEDDEISGMAKQDSLMKQHAVSDFVKKMQQKFGVSAEQIVAAFAQMSPQTLAAPVSESTQAFVNELNLDGDQKAEAAKMYNQMLKDAGDMVFSEQMMGNTKTSVDTEVLDQKQFDQKVLDQSLRQLNQKFFENAQVEDKNQNGKVSVAGMTAASGTLAAQPVATQPAVAQASGAMSTAPTISSSGTAAKHLSGNGKKSAEEASASTGIIAGLTSAFNGDHKSASSVKGGSDWSSQGQQQQQQQPQTNAQAKIEPQVAVGAFTPEINKGKLASAQSGDGKQVKALKGDDLLNALNSSLGQNLTSSKLAEGSTAAGAAMLPNAVQPNHDEKAANIQQLIKQAQVIIKQGGGEMKVQMSPEGMGQVNLKVAVENGQVNIQMVAHNKEAKKMIEDGLTELKSSLAAHKLQVDTLKVDLSEGISKQMQDQLADHQRNQAREMAQNFLSNMRDERQGNQQGFFDSTPGYRSYKNMNDREGGVPQAPTTSTASIDSRRKQSDRRLDMVA